MKLVIFSLILVILIAPISLAEGLGISEIRVYIDYDDAYAYKIDTRDRLNFAIVPVSNNSKINAEILPGSDVTFSITVENSFRGDNPKIKGAEVKVKIDGIDHGADLDERSSDFDLAPGDDQRVDIKIGIPLDVESGTYKTLIESEGEDRNGTIYTARVELKLPVKKLSHDIRIEKVFLNPSILECKRKAKLVARIINAGSSDEDQVALEFRNANLGINSADKDLSLASSTDSSDRDITYAKTLDIEVPSFFKSGNYPVLVNLYWKNFVLFDSKTVDLVVKDCAPRSSIQRQKEDNNKTGVVSLQPENQTQETKGETQIGRDTIITKEPFSNSLILISVLLGALAVIVSVVLLIIGRLKNIY